MSSGQLFGTDAQTHADTQYNQATTAYGNATQNLGAATQAYTNQGNEAAADLASIVPTQQFVPTPNVPGYNGSQGYYTAPAITNGSDTGGSGYGLLASNALTQYNQANAALPSLIQQEQAATGLANNSGTNPYSLNSSQQLALNTQIDQLNNSQNTALNDIQAAYNARGITDPSQTAAAQALIRQNYGSAVAGQTAAFQNQAAQTAATGANNLIGTETGLLEGGASNAQNAIGGINTLAGESASGLAGTGGTYANLSNQQNSASNQSQSNANAATGSLLSLGGALGGYAANGGFDGSGSSGSSNTSTTDTSSLFPTSTSATPFSTYTSPTKAASAVNTSGSGGTASPLLATNAFSGAPVGVNAFNGGVSTAGNASSIFGANGPGYGNYQQGANG
jgi:hypothetical protein